MPSFRKPRKLGQPLLWWRRLEVKDGPATKERDAESGLDNFGARYDSSSLGRFMTPDWAAKPTTVPYASFGDPQTLNLYAYVENEPINRVDAEGHAAGGNMSVWQAYLGSLAPQQLEECDFACLETETEEQQNQQNQPAQQNQQGQAQNLDGQLHVTHNVDGTTTSYEGTNSSSSSRDANGNYTVTGTATITTQKLDAHGNIQTTETTTATTSITVDSSGRVTQTTTSSHTIVSNDSQQAQSMRAGSLTLGQYKVTDFISTKPAVKTLLDHANVTVHDVWNASKALGHAFVCDLQCGADGW